MRLSGRPCLGMTAGDESRSVSRGLDSMVNTLFRTQTSLVNTQRGLPRIDRGAVTTICADV